MQYDVIIVGGGIAGLTSAAYLSRDGYRVLICEKEKTVGGLVNSFEYKGFTFDGGIRAIENSGIVMPMLRQLGIEIPFVRSIVSLGIEKDIIKVEDKESLKAYQTLLEEKFPNHSNDIERILSEISKIMKYMDILYGIDNPLFMDMFKNKKYLFFTVMPWLIKYLFTVGKINRLNQPVETYLHQLTDNQALIDMIAQHFFKNTPTFFALSYFSLYLDYQYPKDGTGMIIDKLKSYIIERGGIIQTSTEIKEINPEKRMIRDADGQLYEYDALVWASDLNQLYQRVDINQILNQKVKAKTIEFKDQISEFRGGDSIQTTYLTVDLEPTFFKDKCSEHFFYTPKKDGLYNVEQRKNNILKSENKDEILEWVKEYLDKTTYEISIPVLRNNALAPKGNTGLIVSTLMDYDLVKKVESMGWYKEYKSICETHMIEVLDQSIFDGLKEKVIDHFSSTPLTIEKRTANKDGAITGWAFTNPQMPVVHRMTKVAKSVLTTMPNIYQAGQWSYSPAGLPISILTGKLAADQIKKRHKISK